MRYGRLIVAMSLASFAPAESRGQTAADLRKQIETLQSQVEALERLGETRNRVTQIGSSRSPEIEPQMVLRIYDVSDLFTLAAAYEAQHASDLSDKARPLFPIFRAGESRRMTGTGGFGGMGGGGFFAVEQRQPPSASTADQAGQAGLRTSVDDLIEVITATISPTSWDEVGGPSSIEQLGTTLIVSADRNSHEQIEGLLALFRERWKTLRTISVRAYWLWLDDEQLGRLTGADDDAGNGSSPFGVVNESAWNQLLEELRQEDPPGQGGYRAILTCYNGQTVHAVSGGQSLAVTQLTPVASEPAGEIGYEPTVAVVQEGPALQITPMASRSAKYVVLDVHSRVNLFTETAAQDEPVEHVDAASAAPQQVVAALDRPQLLVHRLSTTLRVPVDRVALVGGMSLDGGGDEGRGAMYLFVKTSVQELADDEAEPAPDDGLQAEPANGELEPQPPDDSPPAGP